MPQKPRKRKAEMEPKKGDLVTVEINDKAVDSTSPSNVYVVVENLGSTCILNHPMYPECLIQKPTEMLNKTQPRLMNPLEKCLVFCIHNKELLQYNDEATLYSNVAYFLLNKKLSSVQCSQISKLCGIIAKVLLNNNLGKAITTVNENCSLLDEFNASWYENFKEVYSRKRVAIPREGNIIFNQAGFVLAQLKVTSTIQTGKLYG